MSGKLDANCHLLSTVIPQEVENFGAPDKILTPVFSDLFRPVLSDLFPSIINVTPR